METVSLQEDISHLMKTHNVPYHTEEEWVVPYGELPAIRATWFPQENNGRLDVEVLLEDERMICESFAGIGAGTNAISDGLQNFCANSFHVFLAAFWKIYDEEQVVIENWDIGGKPFKAVIGNIGTRANEDGLVALPENLFETLEQAVKEADLANQISWFRYFFCNIAGDFTFEALKNNENWKPGLDALKSMEWKSAKGYYSIRNFLVVMPL